MANFRTTIPKLAVPFEFKHPLPVLCIGSCFAEHMGAKLTQHKFITSVNPFGILYNPHSIGNTLKCLIQGNLFEKKDLIAANGLWHSFDHHGHFSKPDSSEVIKTINDVIKEGQSFLRNTKRLILTFGTSNVFVYNKTKKIVANCHKIPNQEFERKSLSVEDIVKQIKPLLEQIKITNPELEVLLTVSPVRHIRDGLIENQRSKARLLLACDQLSDNLNFVHYFPSYEIMTDDLRDYRFYDADMIHPNDVAIDYIWSYFSQCFFDTKTTNLNAQVFKITSAAKHRPFHPETSSHQLFLKKQLETINALKLTYGFLDFTKEEKIFEQQLIP